MALNKEQAIIDFLRECSAIADNPLFFNFINAKPDNKQLITSGNEKSIQKPYIDGSVMKRYTFTIIDFRSISYQAIVNVPKPQPTTATTETTNAVADDEPNYSNENVEEYIDIQAIIDWIDEQNDARHYPYFGSDCEIDEMKVLTDNPVLNGTDTQLKPALAKYSFSIQIDYIDKSKVLK